MAVTDNLPPMAGKRFSARKLKRFRLAMRPKLSMYEVARRAEMYYSNYWNLEQGKRPRPAADTLFKLAEVLGCSVEDLME